MALSWWEKGLWQICMHHWTVHAKVEFQKCPWDVSLAGVHSTTLDPELRNERFTLISFMGFPAMLGALQPFQICIFKRKYSKWTFSNGPQLMRKRFMANLHASLDSTCKSRISKMSMRCQSCSRSIPQLWILNSEMNLNLFPIWGVCSTTFDPELMGTKVYGKFACIIEQYMQK